MKFINQEKILIDVSGTSLQGYIMTSYAMLLIKLGKPKPGDGRKTDAEWSLLFADGTVATVYNWKNGKAYMGEDGLELKEINEWHIGGFDERARELVCDAVFGKAK